MPNVGDHRQSHSRLVQALRRGRTADAPAEFLARVFGYRGLSSGGTPREEFSHSLRELLHVLPIQLLSPDGFPISAPLSDFTVSQSFLFALFQRLLFDYPPLPFKPPPRAAPP